jgi:hypothetical protein
MRWVPVLVVVVLLPAAAAAGKLETRLQLEVGSELDSNPHREPSEAGNAPVPAAVGRGGIRFSLGWRPAPRRVLSLSAVAAAKKFVGLDGTGGAAEEDVAVVALDGRFDAGLAGRPLALGVRVGYYDALERDTGTAGAGDHDFRTGHLTGVLVVRGDDDHRVTLSLGVRGFEYKPDARFDFFGEQAGLGWRKSFTSSGGDGVEDGASWDLGVEYGFARRVYDDEARVNGCAPDAELEAGCLVSSDLGRVDLVHSAAVELGYAGERLYGVRYELSATLSNSFGQSLVRHRLELTATTETWWSVFVTARLVVQVNQFLDPLLLSRDIGLYTIEDENRNSLGLHATRDVGSSWAIEARLTLATNEFATEELRYRRATVYGGLVWRSEGW